ncbi:MAG TPA: glycosyltransferase family 2 protein [Sulfuricaulis sp.]|nr:glycosyltransferase family 2 protein [Sulfuricaulis sp.]
MNTPPLYVVIPVLNRWHQTRRCLERLIGGRQPPMHIIVVDHGSTDGTRAGLVAHFPQVTYLADDPAHWWAGATNTGIRAALERGAEWLVLLNNDCYVKPDTLATLLHYAERHPAAIIAPVQRRLDNGAIAVARAGSCFLAGYPTLLLPWHTRHVGEPRLLRSRLIIGGRGVLIPRRVFERVGMFDEARLPHYGADHDFYLRCREQGVPLYVAADAAVELDSSHTSLATRLGSLTLSQFRETLTRRRSHRNLHDLATLFRLHYPIPGLWWVGVGLNLARYVFIYLAARGFRLLVTRGK